MRNGSNFVANDITLSVVVSAADVATAPPLAAGERYDGVGLTPPLVLVSRPRFIAALLPAALAAGLTKDARCASENPLIVWCRQCGVHVSIKAQGAVSADTGYAARSSAPAVPPHSLSLFRILRQKDKTPQSSIPGHIKVGRPVCSFTTGLA